MNAVHTFEEVPFSSAEDIIFGHLRQENDESRYVGNSRFIAFVKQEIQDARKGLLDYLTGLEKCIENFLKVYPGTNFFLALSEGRVCRMPEQVRQTFVRQVFVDTFGRLYPTRSCHWNEASMINFIEARAVWFATFAPTSMQHIWWRVMEECPTRQDLLRIIALQDPTQAEIQQMINENRNTFYVWTDPNTPHPEGIPKLPQIILRDYKTFGTYRTINRTLSAELTNALNAYCFENVLNQEPEDGHRLLFPTNITNKVIKEWFKTSGLCTVFPRKASNMFSFFRKIFTSLSEEEVRLEGNHVYYKNEMVAFPGTKKMIVLQLHDTGNTRESYSFNIYPILKESNGKVIVIENEKHRVEEDDTEGEDDD